MSNLHDHAVRELDLIGETDESDPSMRLMVLQIIDVFAAQGHSGASAAHCVSVVERLMRFQPLSPLTDDHDEWIHVGDMMGGEEVWQNRRNSEAFSEDGGKTYHLLSETTYNDDGPVRIKHDSAHKEKA